MQSEQSLETTNPQAIDGQSRSKDRNVIQSAIDLLDQWLSDIEAAEQFEKPDDTEFTRGYAEYRKHCKARMEATVDSIKLLRLSMEEKRD